MSAPNRPESGAIEPADRAPTPDELAAVARFVPCSLTATLANDAAWAASCVVGELDRLVVDELRPADLSERLETLATTVRRCGAMADAVANAHGGHWVRGDLAEWMAGSPSTERAARLLAGLARKREGGAA
jgi:hypothetical protein